MAKCLLEEGDSMTECSLSKWIRKNKRKAELKGKVSKEESSFLKQVENSFLSVSKMTSIEYEQNMQ
jgi:hypothetical protein